jgi:hypothetical protein
MNCEFITVAKRGYLFKVLQNVPSPVDDLICPLVPTASKCRVDRNFELEAKGIQKTVFLQL